MRKPESPPDFAELMQGLTPEAYRWVLSHIDPLVGGRYLHWDELRYRPAPDNVAREAWWASILLGRVSLQQELPLLDKLGKPFRFALPTQVLIALHHIDRDAAGQLRAAGTPIHEEPHRYLISSLIEEAITSSQLEGASTTRQVAAAMLRSGRKPRDHSEKMIFNNYRAMEHLRSIKNDPLTPARILELHRILTEETLEDPADAGRLRQADDIRVVDPRDGTVLHAPPEHRELPERLERLCAFANASEDSLPFVHPVLRAILLHFMIGYDHPFADGNGRTARALFYWSLARSGYWLLEYTSISHIIRLAPAKYMRAYLHAESDNNDTTYFLIHQLSTIRKAIAALQDYLERKQQEQKETEKLLSASHALRTRFNHRQSALLNHALRNPGAEYRIDAHQRAHNVVYQTARTDLLSLGDLGLLIKARHGNAHVFYVPEDLRQRLQQLA